MSLSQAQELTSYEFSRLYSVKTLGNPQQMSGTLSLCSFLFGTMLYDGSLLRQQACVGSELPCLFPFTQRSLSSAASFQMHENLFYTKCDLSETE